MKLNPSPLLADKERGRGVAVCGWCLWGHTLAFLLVVSVMQKAAVELCRLVQASVLTGARGYL